MGVTEIDRIIAGRATTATRATTVIKAIGATNAAIATISAEAPWHRAPSSGRLSASRKQPIRARGPGSTAHTGLLMVALEPVNLLDYDSAGRKRVRILR